MPDTLTPAGSSTYDSSTMYVGDGTWDSTSNTFLLPNLVGLNFATMQYNSMSSRFSALPEYHKLIIGHGVLAAIVFLLVLPSAIFIARFYYANPRLALRLHIWLQLLTVGLVTVVFVLGWFAVGPERSLTNPHHGIGVAIYTLILVQAIGGGLIHRWEKGKERFKIPLKLMLHQWFGRAIALLGLAQIPLGMTLYGSPKYLFILYAVVVFGWVLLYFILSYRSQPIIDDDGFGSYYSGPTRTEITEDRRTGRSEGGHGLRNAAVAGAGLGGLAALRKRSKSRRREEEGRRTERSEVTQSRRPSHSRHSESHVEEEKLGPVRENHTWRNRLLGAGAGLGAYESFKRLFNRRKRIDEESETGSYRPPLGGNQSVNRVDVTRVEHGQAPMSPSDPRMSRLGRTNAAVLDTPTRQPLRSRTSVDSRLSYDSRDSWESDNGQRPVAGRDHSARNGIAALGVFGFLREKQRQRRDRKEERRVEEMRQYEQENIERIDRANSRRNTNRPDRRRPSIAETAVTDDYDMTGSHPELSRQHLPQSNVPPLPASAAAVPVVAAVDERHNPINPGYDTNVGVSQTPNTNMMSPFNTPAYPVTTGSVSMPQGAVEPDPSRLTRHGNMSNHHLTQDTAAGLAGGVGSAAMNEKHSPTRSSYRERTHARQSRRDSASQVGLVTSPATVASPPVSVKVKMHNDGRHVTLRRLNEEEAAAEREARHRERRQRRRRAESLSSGVEDEETRFRRNDGVRPTANMPNTSASRPPIPAQMNEMNLPPPPAAPPVPAHSSPHGMGFSPSQMATSGLTSGVGSPGTYETGTGTDLSAFDNNRRRRRAERAAAKQRAAQQGARVEFS